MKVTTRDLNAFASILHRKNKFKLAAKMKKEVLVMVENNITSFELDENGSAEEREVASLIKDAEECLRYLKSNDRKQVEMTNKDLAKWHQEQRKKARVGSAAYWFHLKRAVMLRK